MTDEKIISLLSNNKEHKALRYLYTYQHAVISYVKSNNGNKLLRQHCKKIRLNQIRRDIRFDKLLFKETIRAKKTPI